MNQRFDELLPWYVNGSLKGEDRAWFESYLKDHPEAAAELDWTRSLRTRMQDNGPAVPDTIGLSKVMTRIRADKPTLASRITAFLGNFGMRPTAAFAALAIVAVQGFFILDLMHGRQDDAAEMRALRASVTEDGPMLKINFAPDAKETDIRLLLVSIQGRLAGGPGQLGDYFVIVPAGREAALADKVKASPIVQAVSLAPGLPPRGE